MIFTLSQISIPVTLLSASESTVLTQWLWTYNRGKAVCPLIAASGSACALAATTLLRLHAGRMTSRAWVFAAAAVLPVTIAPLTFLVLDRTNDPLKARERKARVAVERGEGNDEVTEETRGLLEVWREWNAVRSLLPVAGAVCAGWGLYM